VWAAISATSVGSERASNNTAWPTAVTSKVQKGARTIAIASAHIGGATDHFG
jgi:hypothetical protein